MSSVTGLKLQTVSDKIFVSFDAVTRGQLYQVTAVPVTAGLSKNVTLSLSDVTAEGKLLTTFEGLLLNTTYTISVVPSTTATNGSLQRGVSVEATITTAGAYTDTVAQMPFEFVTALKLSKAQAEAAMETAFVSRSLK